MVFALLACLIALDGCGAASRPERQVRLRLGGPADGTRVHTGSITLTGTVSPAGAIVLVLGHRVPVVRGGFTAQVPLSPGTNIVDVLAGAPRAQAAMNAVHVVRVVYVPVPDLAGADPSDAQHQLAAIGLRPHVHNSDDFFDSLLPLISDHVCSTSPSAGTKVPPDSQITISVSKTC